MDPLATGKEFGQFLAVLDRHLGFKRKLKLARPIAGQLESNRTSVGGGQAGDHLSVGVALEMAGLHDEVIIPDLPCATMRGEAFSGEDLLADRQPELPMQQPFVAPVVGVKMTTTVSFYLDPQRDTITDVVIEAVGVSERAGRHVSLRHETCRGQ